MSLRRMRHSERTAACLVHMSGVIPIWGALVMGGLLWRFRGRSRPTVFHAMQGIFFHLGFLLVETPALLLVGLGNMIGYLRPDIGAVVSMIAWYLVWAIFAANCVICLMGANAVIDGRDFNYPFFGKRLRPPFEEPPPVRRKREFHTYMTPIPPADEFVTPLTKARPIVAAASDVEEPEIEAPKKAKPPEIKSAEDESDLGESAGGATPPGEDLPAGEELEGEPSEEKLVGNAALSEDEAAEPAAVSKKRRRRSLPRRRHTKKPGGDE